MFQTTNQKEFVPAKEYQPQESFDKSGMVKCSSRMGRDPLEHPRNREHMSQHCHNHVLKSLSQTWSTPTKLNIWEWRSHLKEQISSFSVENMRRDWDDSIHPSIRMRRAWHNSERPMSGTSGTCNFILSPVLALVTYGAKKYRVDAVDMRCGRPKWVLLVLPEFDAWSNGYPSVSEDMGNSH